MIGNGKVRRPVAGGGVAPRPAAAAPVYECDHCGACCTKLIIEIQHVDVVREPRLAAAATPCRLLPAESEWDREYILARGIAGCGCPMHDAASGRCSVYPTRPNVCVSFEAGSEQCQATRSRAGLPELAPVASPAVAGPGGGR